MLDVSRTATSSDDCDESHCWWTVILNALMSSSRWTYASSISQGAVSISHLITARMSSYKRPRQPITSSSLAYAKSSMCPIDGRGGQTTLDLFFCKEDSSLYRDEDDINHLHHV